MRAPAARSRVSMRSRASASRAAVSGPRRCQRASEDLAGVEGGGVERASRGVSAGTGQEPFGGGADAGTQHAVRGEGLPDRLVGHGRVGGAEDVHQGGSVLAGGVEVGRRRTGHTYGSGVGVGRAVLGAARFESWVGGGETHPVAAGHPVVEGIFPSRVLQHGGEHAALGAPGHGQVGVHLQGVAPGAHGHGVGEHVPEREVGARREVGGSHVHTSSPSGPVPLPGAASFPGGAARARVRASGSVVPGAARRTSTLPRPRRARGADAVGGQAGAGEEEPVLRGRGAGPGQRCGQDRSGQQGAVGAQAPGFGGTVRADGSARLDDGAGPGQGAAQGGAFRFEAPGERACHDRAGLLVGAGVAEAEDAVGAVGARPPEELVGDAGQVRGEHECGVGPCAQACGEAVAGQVGQAVLVDGHVGSPAGPGEQGRGGEADEHAVRSAHPGPSVSGWERRTRTRRSGRAGPCERVRRHGRTGRRASCGSDVTVPGLLLSGTSGHRPRSAPVVGAGGVRGPRRDRGRGGDP